MSTAVTEKRIVLCADDFGLTEAASTSIVALAKIGAISAASCVVDGAHIAPYANDLLHTSTQLSFGLHLNLTDNSTGRAAASLPIWLLRGFVLRAMRHATIAQEIERQLNAFEVLFGRPPHFVDGHEHIHQFPIVRDILLEILMGRYRSTVAIRSTVPLVPRGAKANIIALLGGRAMQELIAQHGLRTNTDFAGVYNFTHRLPFELRMRDWLRSLADGGLIMCHPELPVEQTHAPARIDEHNFLASASWQRLRQQCHARLAPFSGVNPALER